MAKKKMTHAGCIKWLKKNRFKINLQTFADNIELDRSQLVRAIDEVKVSKHAIAKIPARCMEKCIEEIESFSSKLEPETAKK